MASILSVKNLQVSFRTQGGILKAVRDVSFELEKGETLAIVGESGSGKSVTSKAIIGILSGNSIVEGGEILFHGMDLLKIAEDDFHKIRGDKISMIFQDPLSSLNPIMKVGHQLTEAMILNGKARQRNAREVFNKHLALLLKALNEVAPEDSSTNRKSCKVFNGFCVASTKLERAYNFAYDAVIQIINLSHENGFLLEKNQKVDVKAVLKQIRKLLPDTVNPFLLNSEDPIYNEIRDYRRSKDNAENLAFLRKVETEFVNVSKKQKPNFFRLGYYLTYNPDLDLTNISVDELDKMCLEYLDNEFMLNFISLVKKGVNYSHNKSIEKKIALLPRLEAFLETVKASENVLDKSIRKELSFLKKEVSKSIDYLAVHKHSVEYSFGISIQHEFNRYKEGVKQNPIHNGKFLKSQAKYQKLVDSGKTPSWKVIPPYLVDLDLTKTNIIKITESIITRYKKAIDKNSNYDTEGKAIQLIDFFKEQASSFVYTVSPGIAKSKALELLKEVGIPEPEIRYNQYPFEFSGGMRQRIVIAIALSANPEILICDEPTTALDVTIQSQILELINKIKEERNLSVIFITHDLGVVANMADKIGVMYAGKIVEYGTSEDIFYDPRHPYTWALLSSMPDLDTKEKLEAIPGTPPNMIYPPKGDAFADRNKYALKIDYEEQPPFFDISPTHRAATWLLHPNAPKVTPPKAVTDRIQRMKKKYGKKGA